MHDFLKDLRQGFRLATADPVFTCVIVATLTLAIGANTIIFRFADVLLLRPLPISPPDRVVFLYSANPERGVRRGLVSPAEFLDWTEQATSLEMISADRSATYTLTGRGDAQRVAANQVTANRFENWGLRAAAGRLFRPEDEAPGAPPVVVLSHGWWMRQFGGDPGIIGRTLVLDGEPHTVVGILTPDIEIGNLSLIDAWTPLVLERSAASRDVRSLSVTALLKPGVDLEQAGAEMRAISSALAQAYPDTNTGWNARVLSLTDAMVGEDAWLLLGMLMAVVVLVLVIACANVTNLMLARGIARRREMALRLALGAGRLRLVRQLVTESLVLGVLGGVGGVIVAAVGLRLLVAATFEPFFRMLAVDGRTLFFVALLSVVTPMLFSLLPALHCLGTNLHGTLKEDGQQSGAGMRGRRTRRALVVAQLSLALMLLAVAGLLVREASAELALDTGIDVKNVLTFRVDLEKGRYPDAERLVLFQEAAARRLKSLPGVASAALAGGIPVLDGGGTSTFSLEGQVVTRDSDAPWAVRTEVGPEYFDAAGIPLVRGRIFQLSDNAGAQAVALVDAEAARRYWPAGDPVGRRIRLRGDGREAAWLQVVGIVGNLRSSELAEPPQPHLYVPIAQEPLRALVGLVRTSGDAEGSAGAVRQQIADIDPNLAVYDMQTLEHAFRVQYATFRALAAMFVAFASVALLLAAAGLYGTMAYMVAARHREIGIRMVLGARPPEVVGMVMREGVRLVLAGVTLGLAGAVLLAMVMQDLLPTVGPFDRAVFAGVPLVLAVVALLAGFLPARHAASIEPAVSLRRG